MTDLTLERLKQEEGYRAQMYKDTQGFWTIGYGCNLSAGWSLALAETVLAFQLEQTREHLRQALAWYPQLDEVRQSVVDDMAFNMGISKLLTFKRTLAALAQGDYAAAADGMKASAWYGQVGKRAETLVKMMASGAWS